MNVQLKVLATLVVVFCFGLLISRVMRLPDTPSQRGDAWKALAGVCILLLFPWLIWCVWSVL